MLKISDNPPQLSRGLERPVDAVGRWHVVHVKPRSEKALAWDLAAKNVTYYLPMTVRVFRSGGRRRQSMLPLFPSYLFYCGDERARLDVLTTGRVVSIIPVAQQDVFIAELQSVHAALATNMELNLYPFATVGRRVRVARGPLQGTEGTLVQAGDLARLVLHIGVLGQGAALEIDASFLEDAA